MGTVFNKLKNRKGESLVESLAAILIFTMASVGMLSMVTAAARINETAKDTDRRIQQELAYAEQGETGGVSGTVTMTLTVTEDSGVANVINVIVADVDIYGTDDGLFAYYKHVTEVE